MTKRGWRMARRIPLIPLIPLLSALGCQGWGQQYAPEYMNDIASATGEAAGITQRATYCGCSWDASYGEVQLHCDPRGADSLASLFYYFPRPALPHLRASSGADVQASFPDHPAATSGFGVAYVQVSYGDSLPQDPRSDIFSQVSFPLFVHHLYLPEQQVTSFFDYSVTRDLAESSVTEAALWCEDYQASLDNILSGVASPEEVAAVDAWSRRRDAEAAGWRPNAPGRAPARAFEEER